MCGLVGIAGKLEARDEMTMKRMLILDFFRGMDSTGLAAIRNNAEVKIAKAAVNPIDLFDMKSFTSALSGYNSAAFIGHNRAATKGKVNSVNAHPFQYGHIVGAHNGTLDQSSWKKLEELAEIETDVDSQAIFAAIAKVGIEAVVPHLQGAWALTWVNLEDGTLNFLRNKERPFWYAYTEDFSKVLWASEYPMIRAATALSNTGYKLFTTEEGHQYFQTMENWWYRFPLADFGKAGAERPKPRAKELKGKEPVKAVTTYTAGNYHPFHTGKGTIHGTTGSSGTGTATTRTTGETKPIKDVIQLVGNKTAPFAGHLSRSKFETMSAYGCSWCRGEVNFEDVGLTVNETDGTILCPECTNSNTQNRLILLPAKMAIVS